MLTKLYVESSLFLSSLRKDQRGVTAIEYALVAAGIAGVVAVLFSSGDNTGLAAAIKAAFAKVTKAIG